MNTNDDQDLAQVLTNSNLPISEFLRKLPNQYRKNKHQGIKITSLYTITQLFKQSDDEQSHITKTEAYEYFQDAMKKQRLEAVANISQFGKLLKLLFKDNQFFKVRRIGSRSSTKYCYFGIELADPDLAKDKSIVVDPKTMKSYITKEIRFRYLNSSNKFTPSKNYKFNKGSPSPNQLNLELDDLFRSFLIDSTLMLSHQIVIQPVPGLIFKCCQNSNVFIKEIDVKMFKMMYLDFQHLDIFNRIVYKQLKPFERGDELSKVYDLIKYFFHDDINHFNVDLTYLKNYFNLTMDPDFSVNLLKLKIINFILKILKVFNYESFPDILLTFKFITTSVLRELSVNRKSTFTLYWYLLSSMDELIHAILEYYTQKKMNY